MLVVSLFLVGLFHETVLGLGHYTAIIKSDGPVVLGAYITFRAEVRRDDIPQEGNYTFKWQDNMKPKPNRFEEKRQGVSIWKISHSPKTFTSGTYEVQVGVYTTDPFEWNLCYGTIYFTLEDHLVGNLILQQKNQIVEKYVSTKYGVQHLIKLHGPDYEYLKLNASHHNIEWMIDGNSSASIKNITGLSWNHQFREPDVTHTITVTIVAVRNPLNSSNSLESSTDVDFVNSTIPAVDTKLNNGTDPSFTYLTSPNITDTTCPQKTQVCGSFSKKITVKAPVENVKIEGNNWLKHGDMLNLKITCNGSAPFNFCKRFFVGSYKILGNETCKYPPEVNLDCDFYVDHYFRDSKLYTVLLIVSNDVTKNITAVGVNIYEVTKHPQLSVVVVPLTASILAIILIIFGVAFYFQNRNSYAIEVADFDFTNNNDDLEYKTFKERLAEAIHNAFNKPEDFSEEDSYNGVPSTSNKKYGSMQ